MPAYSHEQNLCVVASTDSVRIIKPFKPSKDCTIAGMGSVYIIHTTLGLCLHNILFRSLQKALPHVFPQQKITENWLHPYEILFSSVGKVRN